MAGPGISAAAAVDQPRRRALMAGQGDGVRTVGFLFNGGD
jgi:hypothetical protein